MRARARACVYIYTWKYKTIFVLCRRMSRARLYREIEYRSHHTHSVEYYV